MKSRMRHKEWGKGGGAEWFQNEKDVNPNHALVMANI